MARVYFAFSSKHEASVATFKSYRDQTGVTLPLLVSYYYREAFEKAERLGMPVDELILDSGAFSVLNSGSTIDLDDYAAWTKDIGKRASEVYSLDVIGDWRASQRNTEKLWSMGVSAIPTFHYGSPEEALLWCAKHSEKIALGGMVGQSGPGFLRWIQQSFARVWPKRVHGFGLTRPSYLNNLPFDSVDSTSWIEPVRFGRWTFMRGQKNNRLPVRGADYGYDLSANLAPYLAWGKKSEELFARDLALIRA